MRSSDTSLPYEEPGIVQVLIFTSFIPLLNVINSALDYTVYCGLLGQVLIGFAYGTPGAKWLGSNTEKIIVQLGYLGLILIVYEGGLSTSISSLRANLFISCAVALTGVCVPIALSFLLTKLADASSLQAFAAGAALCSTSLGTTFTVLNTSGLTSTRLGVVLSAAAMMDDVVGLVMVQIISSIGGSGGATISAVTVVRPILVSLAFATVVPLFCIFIVRPTTLRIFTDLKKPRSKVLLNRFSDPRAAFVVHTLVLIGFVAGASYAGTSALFAAYEAGACISWWDGSFLASPANTEVQTTRGPDQDSNVEKKVLDGIAKHEPKSGTGSTRKELSGAATYEKYYKQPVERILKPFFFASIGFSIPITQMFTGAVVWRGIVYTLLMAFGKLLCGVWLIRFDSRFKEFATVISHFLLPHNWYSPSMSADEQGKRNTKRAAAQDPDRNDNAGNESPEPDHQTESPDTVATASVSGSPDAVEPEGSKDHQPHRRTSPTPDPKISPKIESFSEPRQDDPPARAPLSLQPALILAFAMVSRGEIGFLVSSIAASNGIFSSDSSSETSDVFLIVTWAIVLCTFVGPVCVGLLVRRLRSLEKQGAGRWDGLGVWGIGS